MVVGVSIFICKLRIWMLITDADTDADADEDADVDVDADEASR